MPNPDGTPTIEEQREAALRAAATRQMPAPPPPAPPEVSSIPTALVNAPLRVDLGVNPAESAASGAVMAAPGRFVQPGADMVGWQGGPLSALPSAPPEPDGPRGSLTEARYIVNQSLGQGGAGRTPAQSAMAARAGELRADNWGLQRSMSERTRAAGTEQEQVATDAAFEIDAQRRRVQDMTDQLEQEEAERRERLTKLDGEINTARQQWQDAVKNTNPHRLLGKSGNVALFALSAAFGGFGEGFSGGRVKNRAFDMMEAAMERDFNAQRVQAETLRDNSNMLLQVRDRLVASGADERAARLAARSMAWEQLSHYERGMALRADGAAKKLQHENAADEMLMRANADEAAFLALASKPTGKGEPTELEKQRMALELRQEQLKTQKMEQELAGGEPAVKETANNRRRAIAQEYSVATSGVETLRAMQALTQGDDAVGPWSAESPNYIAPLRGSKAAGNADEFRKRMEEVAALYAKGLGGPVTDSDKKIADAINDVLKGTYTTAQLQRKLATVVKLAEERQSKVMRGQNPDDVKAVLSGFQAPPAPRSTSDRYKRFIQPPTQ